MRYMYSLHISLMLINTVHLLVYIQTFDKYEDTFYILCNLLIKL